MITRSFRILLVCMAASIFTAGASIAENIRVVIADDQRVVSLSSSSGLLIAGDPSGRRGKLLRFTPESVTRKPVRVRPANGITQVNGKRYRGWVELRKKRNGLLIVINDLDLEVYLRGVISAEIPPDWELEALKAQAVASRTYALYEKKRAGKRSYHILATVMSQVYNGVNGKQRKVLKALKETKGLVLTYRGEVIPAFYHADCGGRTENAAAMMWAIDAPYLKGVDCECQDIIKDGLWEKRMSPSRVSRALRRRGYQVSDITDMSIAGITPAGRVKMVIIRSAHSTTYVPAGSLRAALGNTVIPSLFFELEMFEGEAVFSGRGRGHGVGLCQYGAKEMAGKGHDYKAILSHYYPGAVLSRMK
jgi:stage II sporulation protein D